MTRANPGNGGFVLRQRTPVSARARAAELPPGLVQYLKTGDALLAEPFWAPADSRPRATSCDSTSSCAS